MDDEAPLTHKTFHKWREDEFIPHCEKEDGNGEKLIALESAIATWIRVIGGLLALFCGVAGYLVSAHLSEFRDLYRTTIQNQLAIERISTTQMSVLAELSSQRTTDRAQTQTLLDMIERERKK